jgi:hypothetical protein
VGRHGKIVQVLEPLTAQKNFSRMEKKISIGDICPADRLKKSLREKHLRGEWIGRK